MYTPCPSYNDGKDSDIDDDNDDGLYSAWTQREDITRVHGTPRVPVARYTRTRFTALQLALVWRDAGTSDEHAADDDDGSDSSGISSNSNP